MHLAIRSARDLSSYWLARDLLPSVSSLQPGHYLEMKKG